MAATDPQERIVLDSEEADSWDAMNARDPRNLPSVRSMLARVPPWGAPSTPEEEVTAKPDREGAGGTFNDSQSLRRPAHLPPERDPGASDRIDVGGSAEKEQK